MIKKATVPTLLRNTLKMPSGTSWQNTHAYSLKIEEAVKAMDRRYAEVTGSTVNVVREMRTLSEADTEAEVTGGSGLAILNRYSAE